MASPITSAPEIAKATPLAFDCLHTCFMFPFALDRDAIPEIILRREPD